MLPPPPLASARRQRARSGADVCGRGEPGAPRRAPHPQPRGQQGGSCWAKLVPLGQTAKTSPPHHHHRFPLRPPCPLLEVLFELIYCASVSPQGTCSTERGPAARRMGMLGENNGDTPCPRHSDPFCHPTVAPGTLPGTGCKGVGQDPTGSRSPCGIAGYRAGAGQGAGRGAGCGLEQGAGAGAGFGQGARYRAGCGFGQGVGCRC